MKKTLVVSLMLIVAIGLLPFLISPFILSLTTDALIMAIFAMSLGLIMGYGGLQSLGHSAFFGIGAYTVAVLGGTISNVFLLLFIAILLSCIVALLTGLI